MTTTQIQEYTDASTPLNQQYLNTAAIAESCLIAGSIPGSSGSLTITLGALSYIVNAAGAATFQTHTPAPIAISGGASTTNYVFINAAGTLAQATTNTPGAGFVTLLSCLVNGGNTALTSITQLLPPYASTTDNIGADQIEATSTAALTPTSTLQNSLNRIRKAITNLTGGTFSSAVAAAADVVVGHLIRTGSGSASTVLALSGSTSAAVTSGSTDQAGEITGFGATVTGGFQDIALARVTFSAALPNAPFVQITAALGPFMTTLSTPYIFFVVNVSTTHFEIWVHTATATTSTSGWPWAVNYSLSTP